MDKIIKENNVEKYLNHCKFEKGLDNKSIKAYRIDLLQYVAYAKGAAVEVYFKETIQSYIAYLHSLYKVKTVKRKIARPCLKNMCDLYYLNKMAIAPM